MNDPLPNWIIDVVNALDDYEDTHPGPGHCPDDQWGCLKDVLGMVPADVLAAARAIDYYRAEEAKAAARLVTEEPPW